MRAGRPARFDASLRVSERAARARFDWGIWRRVLAKLQEELAEFTAAAARQDTAEVALEFGDIFSRW